MFERFSDRARRVVVQAQDEARALDHDYIGTEHLLLGLESLGISQETVRQRVEETVGHGQQSPSGHIPFTPRAKKTLSLALEEAVALGHDYIGTEHILLGLIRESDGVAAHVLSDLGANAEGARDQVVRLLAEYHRHHGPQTD
jgi:ATP-dependent Clp protease ATP-binding subunit ClpC